MWSGRERRDKVPGSGVGMDRYDIHHESPIIWAGEWKHWCAEGWRFECNLPVGRRHANCLGIRALQRHYGDENVALGHAMGENGPWPSTELIGVYIKDVEIQVTELYSWMDTWGS